MNVVKTKTIKMSNIGREMKIIVDRQISEKVNKLNNMRVFGIQRMGGENSNNITTLTLILQLPVSVSRRKEERKVIHKSLGRTD